MAVAQSTQAGARALSHVHITLKCGCTLAHAWVTAVAACVTVAPLPCRCLAADLKPAPHQDTAPSSPGMLGTYTLPRVSVTN